MRRVFPGQVNPRRKPGRVEAQAAATEGGGRGRREKEEEEEGKEEGREDEEEEDGEAKEEEGPEEEEEEAGEEARAQKGKEYQVDEQKEGGERGSVPYGVDYTRDRLVRMSPEMTGRRKYVKPFEVHCGSRGTYHQSCSTPQNMISAHDRSLSGAGPAYSATREEEIFLIRQRAAGSIPAPYLGLG